MRTDKRAYKYLFFRFIYLQIQMTLEQKYVGQLFMESIINSVKFTPFNNIVVVYHQAGDNDSANNVEQNKIFTLL